LTQHDDSIFSRYLTKGDIMDIDQLRAVFSDESKCRTYFESVIWPKGRICPHCQCEKSYKIIGRNTRPGLYECARCKAQFTVTTRTPMHSTKLPLWKWILAMYLMANSSKGISSVVMARWVGVTQKSAWKICHAIRQMMAPGPESYPALKGIVELDEKYLGGKPRPKVGVKYKGGKGTRKQAVFVAVERKGPVRSALIDSDKTSDLQPWVDQFVDKSAFLMTDENSSYRRIGEQYAGHSSVKHAMNEYARGKVHSNTAESFNSLLERAKFGVFHHMSTKHLKHYLDEIGFRWDHRVPEKRVTRKGERKIVMVPEPPMTMLKALLRKAAGTQLRWTLTAGISFPKPVLAR
jgi:transposase-like protein